MNPFEEKAREIVDKFLKRPDWIDCGYDDCFVCGTPLKLDKYIKRSEAIVDEMVVALQAEYLRGRETMREDILTTLKDYCVTPYPLMPQAENHWWYEAIDNFKKKFIEYVRQPRSHQGD